MVKYLKRKDIDIAKYDDCVENSLQSRIFGFSWYLDIVADNWDVLVFDNYKAVMPIPWRKKYGIKYIYPPFWMIELGVFSLDENFNYQLFFDELIKRFKSIELRLNTFNLINKTSNLLIDKQLQVLPLKKKYEEIYKAYRKDRRKDLISAQKNDLTEKWNDNPEKLIYLFKNNVGKRTSNILDKDYSVLHKLITICIQKNKGKLLSIYNKNNDIVASGFFLKHKNTVTILVSSTDFKNRKNGANTFLIDRAIYKYQKNYSIFNFGGSSMQSIASYFLSFGTQTIKFQQIKFNKLPFLIKLFKR